MELCIYCNGSGEGLYDGSVCMWCHGTGVTPIENNEVYDDN